MTGTREAEKTLRGALRKYALADTEDKQEIALLRLHGGMDRALRAYLTRLGMTEVDSRTVNYPALVDLVRDHTNLFAGDPSLPAKLVSLNNTRNRLAHFQADNLPSPSEVAHDAAQYVKLIRSFWPTIFREPFPEGLLATGAAPAPTPKPAPAPQTKPTPEPAPDVREPRPPRWPQIRQLLRTLWSDQSAPHLEKWLLLKRLASIVVCFALAKFLEGAAVFTAGWPAPVKYGGVVLFILAMALFVWSLILIWKVLRQIRLKGVLIIFAVTYVLLLSAVVLTSTSSLPWSQVAWQTTRDWASLGSRAAVDAAASIISAPGDFRAAYVGHRRPVRVSGTDPDDPSYLTPIPANQPERLEPGKEPTTAPGQPAPEGATTPEVVDGSLPLPDCPDPQARLTAPRVGQVIQDQVAVKGTAKIDAFDYYKFEYRRAADSTGAWNWIASFDIPVQEGLLGTWDVSGLPADRYILRLTVVNKQGNYPFTPCEVTIQVMGD